MQAVKKAKYYTKLKNLRDSWMTIMYALHKIFQHSNSGLALYQLFIELSFSVRYIFAFIALFSFSFNHWYFWISFFLYYVYCSQLEIKNVGMANHNQGHHCCSQTQPTKESHIETKIEGLLEKLKH
jgi:hypothetical protein